VSPFDLFQKIDTTYFHYEKMTPMRTLDQHMLSETELRIKFESVL
jgi:hypothetical protein